MERPPEPESSPPASSRRAFLLRGASLAGAGFLGPGLLHPKPAAAAPKLEFASALEAAEAIRRRRISSEELTRAVLARIGRFHERVNAIATLVPEKALEQARQADRELSHGEMRGPFHGVPGTIKDTFETQGIRTTAGAPFLSDHVPSRDAAVVERLKAAGMVVLGKSNVPYLAGDHQTYNAIFGVTRNPWDPKRTPGGSTGGGAAALAAGLSYLSVGSDIGGSIRNPASFCGVFGHKSTLGVIPYRGHIPPLPGGPPAPLADLPVAGPLARSAADLKAAMEVLGGPEAEQARAWSWTLPPPRHERLRDFRLGFVLDDPFCPVLPEVREVLARAIQSLKKAGAKVQEGWPEEVRPWEQFKTYYYLLIAIAPPALDEKARAALEAQAEAGDELAGVVLRAATRPYLDYYAALGRAREARRIWQAFFREHDAFLMPTAFTAAFPHDPSEPIWKRVIPTPSGPRAYLELLRWISFATLTGLPATTAPAGLTKEGLPVGLQILGPYLEDATPIAVAAHLEKLGPGFQPPPGFGG